eukprot:TRINITY_DN4389_c0_g1_i1.p1 TRINITY_DN4389_c0_g1~~TRINITY_DN4389_c0_g1_i1.p1  ORF type:complete len:708 (-),score=169.18 TRINITY_DN4389_c0_g1_i1:53-2176(-)
MKKQKTVFSLLLVLWCVISFVALIASADDDRDEETLYLYDQIYKSLEDASPCFRLLGIDTAIGCAAKDEEGPSGELLPLFTQDAIEEYLLSTSAGRTETPIIAVIAPSLFIRANVESLLPQINSKILKSSVQGFLVLHTSSYLNSSVDILKPQQWSPELKNPNREYGLYPNSTVIWNPIGDGMTYINLPVPVFLLTKDESEYVLSLVRDNNERKARGGVDSFAMWGAQLNAFMYGTHNAATCFRRDECDPLGGQSVWGVISGADNSASDDIVMVMSGMSGTSYFKYEAAAADSDLSAVVATLSAVHSLFLLKNSGSEAAAQMKRKIMFALFEGEGYGYIGSKRFVRDVVSRPSSFNTNSFNASRLFDPLTLFSQLYAIVNPNQIGLTTNGNETVYVHSEDSSKTNFIFDALKNASLGMDMTVELVDVSANNNEIPPSSVMSFLVQDRTIPSVVLTDHSGPYQNKYFGSRFDNVDNIDYNMVCDAATLLTRTLFLLSTSSYVDPSFLQANCTFVNTVLDCFLKDNNCSLLHEFDLDSGGPSKIESNYVGVYGGGSMRLLPAFAYEFLANASAVSRFHSSICNCTTENPLCVAETCMSAPNIQKHVALSPSMVWEDGEWKVREDPNQFNRQPVWAESRWVRYGVRLFQLEHPKAATYLLLFGSFELLISIAVAYFLRRYFLIPTDTSSSSSPTPSLSPPPTSVSSSSSS